MRSVFDRNVVMRRIPVLKLKCHLTFACTFDEIQAKIIATSTPFYVCHRQNLRRIPVHKVSYTATKHV